MILLETNSGNYKRNVSDVFLQDSVLLARLILNYFSKKGFILQERSNKWNNDLSNKHGEEGKYKTQNWEYAWHNQGITFKFKETKKAEWPEGTIQLGIKKGYAIIKIDTNRNNNNIEEMYKVSLNKTVLELCQSLVRKYRTHLKGKSHPDDVYQANSIEKRFVNLYKSKGFKATFDKERNKYFILTLDQNKIFKDEKVRKVIYYVLGSSKESFPNNLVLEESINEFIKITKYIIKRYASMGYYLSDNQDTDFVANSSSAATLSFSKGSQYEIEKGEAHFKYLSQEMIKSKNKLDQQKITQLLSLNFKKIIKLFFEDVHTANQIIDILKHI